ncbi:hypothetical protein K3495_g13319 [Podosphaera aphanis]|nr:hypothetical protein K3495_g13319 [Podosphaera aphanis]
MGNSSLSTRHKRGHTSGSECNSKLKIKLSLKDRTLTLSLYHKYHTPHEDIGTTLDQSQRPCEDKPLGPTMSKVSAVDKEKEVKDKKESALVIYTEAAACNNKKFVKPIDEIRANNTLMLEKAEQIMPDNWIPKHRRTKYHPVIRTTN